MYKFLNKKKYKDCIKGVYIELSKGPDNTSDYLDRGNQILSGVVECMSHENKENIQVFVICPLCRMLCSYGETHTNFELLKELSWFLTHSLIHQLSPASQ